jgi:septal ring factor EnvC (AmiA/AmiB activator)
MKAKPLHILALLVLVLIEPGTKPVLAQKSISTGTRLEEIREEIAEEERRLEKTKNAERMSLAHLSHLNRQLSLREELVRTYQLRIDQLIFERDSLQVAISHLGSQVGALREEYQQRATHAYKFGRQHDAALILSASSINQMLVRIGYLRRFSDRRRAQLDGLRSSSADLTSKRTQMQRKLVESEVMLTGVDREQDNLDELLGSVRTEIKRIRQEKEDRTDLIAEKRTAEQELVIQVRALIASSSNRTRINTAALTELTTSFAGARALLPWPADGTVTEPYGDIVHPEFGTRTPNPGILIATEPSAEVRAVFNGRVTSIDILPDMGRFAIVEHGGFHTVYGNLSLFYVSVGDEITTGQLMGRSGTAAEPRGQAVFFAVFQDGEPEDPLNWLSR